jgi:hypothetical protein
MCSSTVLEQSTPDAGRSTRGPYSMMTSPPQPQRRRRTPKPKPTRTNTTDWGEATVSATSRCPKGHRRRGRPPPPPAVTDALAFETLVFFRCDVLHGGHRIPRQGRKKKHTRNFANQVLGGITNAVQHDAPHATDGRALSRPS